MSVYVTMGLAGYIGAGLYAWLLQPWLNGVTAWTVGGMTILGTVSFFVTGMIEKIIAGSERFVQYHHQLAFYAASVPLFLLCDTPVWAGLDLAAMCFGVFATLGRQGCRLSGCCHGRPLRQGTHDTASAHGATFPAQVTGQRLFPTQNMESIVTASLVVVGTWLLLGGEVPGGFVFALYVAVYGVLRFELELFRGDLGRGYWLGLSEAQWTAFGFTLFIAVVTEASIASMALGFWGAPLLIGVHGSCIIWRYLKRPAARVNLGPPEFLAEFLDVAERSVAHFRSYAEPLVATTTAGLRLLGTVHSSGTAEVTTYSISGFPAGVDPRTASTIGLALWRQLHSSRGELSHRVTAASLVVEVRDAQRPKGT